MDYRINVVGGVSPDNSKLVFQSTIEVSSDGGNTWSPGTAFVDRFPVAVADATILAAIKKRAMDYVNANENLVVKTDLQGRVDAISSALSGLSKSV